MNANITPIAIVEGLTNNEARAAIQRDLETEFREDDEARAKGGDYKPLGADCDRVQWQKVRALWLNNASLTGVPGFSGTSELKR